MVAASDADKNLCKERNMKTVSGLEALISARRDLPKVGWIFVNKGLNKASADALVAATFHIPEDEDDEFYGEDHLASWLEVPIFLAILDVRAKNIKDPAAGDFANAAIYYLKNDDFLE
ncbi:hypothetical protein BTK96_000340 [Burkholderia pyrrocinia]|uniref:hypothetical protein n=1 Tax=Burkholderia sp. IT-111MI5 TaxID=3026439 RepID=UPI002A32DA89|nr:hypothetical protein [Burkholderia pyrrocinia]EKS9893142.1 hypothetical protein [Burkholderia pyrrocinia]EKS9908916.1 hypothetical protein [Burkholderia pyrrocinia]